MHQRRVRFQPHPIARIELMTFAKHGDDLFAAQLGDDLRFRPRRLDHYDLGLGAVVRDGEVLGTDAIHGRPALGIGGRTTPWPLPTNWGPTYPATRCRHLALEEVYPPWAGEDGPQLVVRPA